MAEEYLNTSWRHSSALGNIIFALRQKYPEVKSVPGVTWQLSDTRYCVPDVAVTLAVPQARFITTAPYIAIEVLSEEDRFSQFMEKLEEYAATGAQNIWVLDPSLNLMFVYHTKGLREVKGDVISTGDGRIQLTREEIFQD